MTKPKLTNGANTDKQSKHGRSNQSLVKTVDTTVASGCTYVTVQRVLPCGLLLGFMVKVRLAFLVCKLRPSLREGSVHAALGNPENVFLGFGTDTEVLSIFSKFLLVHVLSFLAGNLVAAQFLHSVVVAQFLRKLAELGEDAVPVGALLL